VIVFLLGIAALESNKSAESASLKTTHGLVGETEEIQNRGSNYNLIPSIMGFKQTSIVYLKKVCRKNHQCTFAKTVKLSLPILFSRLLFYD
jgi:hypothetical protein